MLKTRHSRQLAFIVVLLVAMLAIWTSLGAQNVPVKNLAPETTLLLSPHCDADQLRGLGTDGLLNVVEPSSPGPVPTFQVTLDPQKLSFTDLTKKMQNAGCF